MVTAVHSSSGRQPNFAALNRGRVRGFGDDALYIG